jgi:hypothetical protein
MLVELNCLVLDFSASNIIWKLLTLGGGQMDNKILFFDLRAQL